MLVRDAKRICPDVIIELGEDLTRFRDASKELYNFIKAFSWDGRLERLGFDEVGHICPLIVGVMAHGTAGLVRCYQHG